MRGEDYFLKLDNFWLGEGIEIRLWEDFWIGRVLLKSQYINFYNIFQQKQSAITTTFSMYYLIFLLK
jgi:hypothetical protein